MNKFCWFEISNKVGHNSFVEYVDFVFNKDIRDGSSAVSKGLKVFDKVSASESSPAGHKNCVGDARLSFA
jgi:hypothetical protein